MQSELEKVDLVRSRFDVSYEEARNALNRAEGDVVTALAIIEKEGAGCVDLLELAGEVANEVHRFIEGPPIKKLRVKYGNKLLTERSVELTAVTALAVTVAAVIISKLVIEVEQGEEGAAS